MAIGRKQYPFHLIEPKWQAVWDAQQTFRAWNPGEKLPPGHPFAVRHGLEGKSPSPSELPPKRYILDMFPYPSGAGLHVGHPEGYTATDILSRYRRAAGFNVLHPMGWDAFGLPAEQYAIKTGQHPRKTTEENIATFKRQIKSLGFSYDWSREVDTTDPAYFKWTQWIFLKLYNSWFNPKTNKAEPISIFDDVFSDTPKRAAEWRENDLLARLRGEWEGKPEQQRKYWQRILTDGHRMAYSAAASVWWCEELGTVLANEEVIDGKSEVGGFPVVRRPMRQWMLRITAYAERLLADLDGIDWSSSLKEMQRNWIGRSEGAEVQFLVPNRLGHAILEVFTTRPDTLFGATYMVLAPELLRHSIWFEDGTIPENWPSNTPSIWTGGAPTPRMAIEQYQSEAARKSDLERTELSKDKTGVFTGAHAINPLTGERIPIWIADYVLASYGTGAIMAVPAHDDRDFEFAHKYGLPSPQVVVPPTKDLEMAKTYLSETRSAKPGLLITGWAHEAETISGATLVSKAYCDGGIAVNSANKEISINGLPTAEAKSKITNWLELKGIGKRTINYRLRDWLFSRQRYWGEPFPIVWKVASYNENKGSTSYRYSEALRETDLPLLPPTLSDYKPTPDGEPPLARARDWVKEIPPDFNKGEIDSVRETNTMPQWAGSCWYYLRYLDAQNSSAFVGKEAERYWMSAGGAVCDRRTSDDADTAPLQHAGVDLYVGGTEHAVLHLLYARFWHKVLFDLGYVSTAEPFFKLVNQGIILGEDGQKMSKSRGNVINPDDVLKVYGADAFRLYEMFMGPLEMVKPWNTQGVEGVYRFLGRVWRLFVDEASETEFEQAATTTDSQEHAELLRLIRLNPAIQDAAPSPAQLKTSHACIRKVTEDLDAMRFNTAISALMVFVNEAMTWEIKPRAILKDFLVLLQPFAPHIAEELWSKFSPASPTIAYEPWPRFDPALLVEDTLEIPVQVNGKLRDVIKVPADADNAAVEAAARASDKIKPFLEGKTVKKIIVVPKKLVNVVIG